MDTIHNIQEKLEDFAKNDDISEEAFRQLSQEMAILHTKYQQIYAEAHLLDYRAKLDIVKICLNSLKELGEDNDEVYVEAYATIGRTQLASILGDIG